MHYLSAPRRAHLLDEARGICILLMIAYHVAYDLVYLFGIDIPVFHSPAMRLTQSLIAGGFIFIAGIVSQYSRSNLKRGLIALAFGLGISLVTFFLIPGQMIWFGILHFLGVSMILFALLRPQLDRLPDFSGMLCCILIFVLTTGLPSGTVGLPGLPGLALPRFLYGKSFLLPLGFGGSGADYFPLFPWLFLFLAGTYLGRLFVRGDMPFAFYRVHLPFLAAIGRRSLIIYLLHQPLAYGLLWLIFRLAGRLPA